MKKIFVSFPFRIFFIAFVVRLIPVIALHSLGIGLDDMYQYDMLARSLASGNGYRWYAYNDLQLLEPYVDFDLQSIDYDPVRGVLTSFRAPLYPFLLASIYLVSGVGSGRFLMVRIIQTLLGAALAPLTYKISILLLAGAQGVVGNQLQRVAHLSAWVITCYPLLILYPLGLATENLFFVLLLSAFLFLLRIVDKPISLNFILAGVFLGLASLTRSIILPFVFLVVLWAWFFTHQKRGTLLLISMIVVIILPWMFRNSFIHKQITGIETSLGYNLYMGYHPKSNGSFTYGVSLDLLPILDDSVRDQIGFQRALTYIKSDPGRIIPLAINRLSFFFGLEKRVLIYFYANNFLGHISTPILSLLVFIMFLPFVLVAGSAPLGWVFLPTKPKGLLLGILVFSYLLPHVLILSEDRFHLAIVPLLTILAANCWIKKPQDLKNKWFGSNAGKIALIVSILVTTLLLVNWCWDLWRDADKIVELLGPNGNALYLPY